MGFFSRQRKPRDKQEIGIAEPASVTVEDFTHARAASHTIHTYAELRRQIHDDLRVQHPEWIEPNGQSPMCDFYEARLMDLLGAQARGLN